MIVRLIGTIWASLLVGVVLVIILVLLSVVLAMFMVVLWHVNRVVIRHVMVYISYLQLEVILIGIKTYEVVISDNILASIISLVLLRVIISLPVIVILILRIIVPSATENPLFIKVSSAPGSES